MDPGVSAAGAEVRSVRVGCGTKAERRADREAVGSYHEAELAKLLECARAGFAFDELADSIVGLVVDRGGLMQRDQPPRGQQRQHLTDLLL